MVNTIICCAIGSKSRFTCFYKSWIRRSAPPRIPLRVKIRGTKEYAGMVELVDSVDLVSTAKSVQVRVLLPAPNPHDSFDTKVSETIVLFLSAKAPVAQGFSAQLPFGLVSLWAFINNVWLSPRWCIAPIIIHGINKRSINFLWNHKKLIFSFRSVL